MVSRVVIGVDPASTKLAMVATCPADKLGRYLALKADALAGTKTAKSKQPAKWAPEACERGYRTAKEFAQQVRAAWADADVHVVIEGPLVGRGGVRSTMVQSFTSGAVQAAFISEGMTVELVHVSTWKAEAVGHGQSTKDDVANFLRLRWSSFFDRAGGDEDLHDAAAIALWGADNFPDRGLGQ